jgi:acetyltransferase-like isoleucine patch superfamily enzyme
VTADELLAVLQTLHRELDREMKVKWDRYLPLNELLADRWERAARLGFGPEASIYDASLVLGDVQVGPHTWIGPFTVLDGSGGLRIGSYCSISSGVQIYTHDSVKWALSGGRAPYDKAPVQIGNCCYVGSQTVIGKGVTIGDHCVIGACSFVNAHVAPFTIAVGSPCKPIGRVVLDKDGDVRLVYDHRQAAA